MADEKLCPLLAMGQADHGDIDSPALLCCREACAWWVDGENGGGSCSMLVLGYAAVVYCAANTEHLEEGADDA